jgi:hypothetical protein
MAIQTRSSSQKANQDVNDQIAEGQKEADTPPPNRAARRAAQKKESKEVKLAKNTKATKARTKFIRSTTARSSGSKDLNPKTTHYE